MELSCFHCGSQSLSWVYHDDKSFCCEGCVMVYDILKANEMGAYYDIAKTPGNRSKIDSSQYFDYLEQDEIKKSVLDFYDGQIARVKLYIPSIHCSSCIWLIENLHMLNDGVLQASVNFTKRDVSITFDETKIKLSELMELLVSINYQPHIKKEEKEKSTKKNKGLLTRLGLAGFAFGNVMLLSFPDYLSADVILNQELIDSFKWLSLALSIPVMLYSADSYFITAWKNLKRKLISIDLPIAVGILAIFLRSLYEIISSTGIGYLDSLTGLVFFMLIGKWFQTKTYDALSFENDYTAYFPLGITRIVDNKEEIIPINQLKKGDKISVRNGEIIPADARLISLSAVVDYSFITGESVPVNKVKDEFIYAGGRVVGNALLLEVEKEVETGYLADLWKDKKSKQGSESAITSTLDVVSKYFTLVILVISVLTFLFWLWLDASVAILAFTSVLIIACPCALALSVPFAFGHAGRIMGVNRFYLKQSSVIEFLSKISEVVFDKTGTLTDPNAFNVDYEGSNLDHYTLSLIKSLVHQSRHPLSRALYAHLKGVDEMEVFDFVEHHGLGVSGRVMNHQIKMGSSSFVEFEYNALQESARVFVSMDGVYLGCFIVKNFYRPHWQHLLETVQKSAGIHVLSGDNEAERVVLGQVIKDANRLHFNQSPKDKQTYVEFLTNQGGRVMMVGDGLNDSGALKMSSVGVAVADDVYQFSPSSDAIISADKLGLLPQFLSFSKSTMVIVYMAIGISFLYNTVGLFYAVTGQLSPLFAAVLMPLSSISVVVFTSLAVMFMAKKHKLDQ